MPPWVAVLILSFSSSPAQAQQSKDAPAYGKAQMKNDLDRSTFYMPLFGAVSLHCEASLH